ncbi:MAG: hypothetical protein HYU31_13945 [Deltaproteobacteria bacterium]|nr:hypothetical protein [Deltaproteobacteria bacterium]
MKIALAISCSRQARIVFSGMDAFSAWVALCSIWLMPLARYSKKSRSVGFAGIFGSRGSSSIS